MTNLSVWETSNILCSQQWEIKYNSFSSSNHRMRLSPSSNFIPYFWNFSKFWHLSSSKIAFTPVSLQAHSAVPHTKICKWAENLGLLENTLYLGFEVLTLWANKNAHLILALFNAIDRNETTPTKLCRFHHLLLTLISARNYIKEATSIKRAESRTGQNIWIENNFLDKSTVYCLLTLPSGKQKHLYIKRNHSVHSFMNVFQEASQVKAEARGQEHTGEKKCKVIYLPLSYNRLYWNTRCNTLPLSVKYRFNLPILMAGYSYPPTVNRS